MLTHIKALLVAGTAGLYIFLNAANAEVTLRFNRWIPVTHFTQSEVIDLWAEDVARVTEGRVTIEFTASSLAPPPRQYQLGVDGISDIVWHAHGYTPGVFPLSEIVELPFTGESAEAISVAYWRVYKEFFEAADMHRGLIALAVHVTPPGNIYNSVRQILSMEDFNGLKIRSTNALVTEALRLFGATPIAAPVTEIRDGLSKGIMDGTTFTDDAIASFSVAEFIKYATKVPGGLYNQSFVLGINPDKWENISAADQAAIMELSGEAFARRMGSVWDNAAAEGIQQLRESGVEVHVVSGEMLATMTSLLAPFEQKWLQDAEAAGVDGAAALQTLRREIRDFE